MNDSRAKGKFEQTQKDGNVFRNTRETPTADDSPERVAALPNILLFRSDLPISLLRLAIPPAEIESREGALNDRRIR